MRINKIPPTGIEAHFGEDEIIVSKTDLKGIITYANDVFLRVSGYTEEELLGAPHNIIRHPAMPRCVFKLLWETVQAGREIFAYVNNLAKNGSHYWVLAHVTPTFDTAGRIVGYHSNRRRPDRASVQKVTNLYQQLTEQEKRLGGQAGMKAAAQSLQDQLESLDQSYEEFIWSLIAAGENK